MRERRGEASHKRFARVHSEKDKWHVERGQVGLVNPFGCSDGEWWGEVRLLRCFCGIGIGEHARACRRMSMCPTPLRRDIRMPPWLLDRRSAASTDALRICDCFTAKMTTLIWPVAFSSSALLSWKIWLRPCAIRTPPTRHAPPTDGDSFKISPLVCMIVSPCSFHPVRSQTLPERSLRVESRAAKRLPTAPPPITTTCPIFAPSLSSARDFPLILRAHVCKNPRPRLLAIAGATRRRRQTCKSSMLENCPPPHNAVKNTGQHMVASPKPAH